MATSVEHRVCVTGAGGYISSMIIRRLLARGYYVCGTVRDPGNEKKVAHLKSLEGASERLELVKADLLDFPSIASAIKGSHGVFHVASPIIYDAIDPQTEVLDPAVKGTINVLEACSRSAETVKRVILTSSTAAVATNPGRASDVVVDEECWSDEDFCRRSKAWYPLSKLLAERAAWSFAKEKKLDLITICPSVVLGPLATPEPNGSNLLIEKILTGKWNRYRNVVWGYVHVEDVVEAHLLAYETPSASGRYLCSAVLLHDQDLIKHLVELFPEYADSVPQECEDIISPKLPLYQFSTKKLQDLGVKFQRLHKCLTDCVTSLREANVL